jgi:hypothetical protein
MMRHDGEQMEMQVVNERNIDKLWQRVQTHRSTNVNNVWVVHLGRDTRAHSPAFASLVTRVAVAMGCRVLDHGIVTTPMLHHAVKHSSCDLLPSPLMPPRPTVLGYYELLVQSYLALLAISNIFSANYRMRVQVG